MSQIGFELNCQSWRLKSMRPQELLDLTGMVAIVTGAGDGIGAGCAEILAAAGAQTLD